MRIKDSTFFQLIILGIFLIAIIHISLKNLLHEPILRANNNAESLLSLSSLSSSVHNNNLPSSFATDDAASDAKQELRNYIKQNLRQINGNCEMPIKGANYYSPYHKSDLNNEETDLSKYFQIDPAVSLAKTNFNGSSQLGCANPDEPNLKDNLTGNPLYFDKGSNGDLAYKPDIWVYDNEKEMNGGMFDGVRGIDNMQSDFSIYK